MTGNTQDVRRLVDHVGNFYVRDRTMLREHRNMVAALLEAEAQNQPVPGEVLSKYCDTVRRYFQGFHHEAQRHLAAIDRRLERLAQLQFNAMAERGVAGKRIDATDAVLKLLKHFGSP